MSTVFGSKTKPGEKNLEEISSQLEFQTKLQAVTNRIHAARNTEELMVELSKDICSLFDADRLTLYVLSEDRTTIVSKVKTGLSSFKDLKLPINEQSIAGYVALTKKMLNVKDVYDEKELRSHHPQLRFLVEVDRRTGYRTTQMLVAPIVDTSNDELIGVIQLINSKQKKPFGTLVEQGVEHLGETLGIALKQLNKATAPLRGKYDGLITDAVLSAEEMELATRSARRKNIDIEDVLLDEFQVKPNAIGNALAKFFGVNYLGFKQDRVKPMDLLKNLKRDFVESSWWIPLEENKDGVLVLTTDPEKVRSSRIVNNIFPKKRIVYGVSTRREFEATVDLFFGAAADSASIGDLLSGMEDEARIRSHG